MEVSELLPHEVCLNWIWLSPLILKIESYSPPSGSVVKNLSAMQEMQVPSLSQEDSPGGGNGNPLQCSCQENPTDGGTWQAAVHGVA